MPLSALAVGDLVLVRPGGRVPADGTVEEGSADVDESMITGESRAVPKEPGDAVVAGTVAAGGSLRVRVGAVGEATALSGIMRLVAAAQASASRAQALADRAAALLFYVAVGAGVITLAWWWASGDPEGAMVRTATVLVIACPHALGLAIPLVIAISTSLGARHGLLVKDRLALERARELDVVIFDKTGTLTKGEPVVAAIAPAPGVDEARAPRARGGGGGGLRAPPRPGGRSRRRCARASTACGREDSRRSPVAVPRPRSRDGAVAVGGPAPAGRPRARDPGRWPATAARRGPPRVGPCSTSSSMTGSWASSRWRTRSARSRPRRSSGSIALGLRVAMITGDAQAVADAVARRLGIDEVAAQVLPEDKAAAVRRFQAGGRRVAMVGDGVNDAPALATADVGIAIGAGTDVAVESAGIVLVRSDPRDVVGAITLSRASYRKMIENLLWATGYNVVAIPVAAGLLDPMGHRPADGPRRGRDEPLDDHRRRQRAAPASPRPPTWRRPDATSESAAPGAHPSLNAGGPAMGTERSQATAIDPVCGMTVQVAERHREGAAQPLRGSGLRVLRPRLQARLRRGPERYLDPRYVPSM